MTLTKVQQETLLTAAKPLIEWLNLNCHPHCEVKVGPGSVELTESLARLLTEEFIQD